jgi:predicted DNA-binding protein YlxM (UPF0122 family)
MQRYRSVKELAAALASGEIPGDVVSPGGAAAALNITRQAVHDRMKRGTLPAWSAEGVVLVDARSVRAAVRRKRHIADSQGELNVST